ncbi:phage portal protein [bacterium]|nr:phage portal protein [bacterium]
MSSVLAKAHVLGETARGETKQLPESPWCGLYEDGTVVEPPYDLDALAALYGSNATHKACVDAKVATVVGLGHRFVSVSAESKDEELARLEELFGSCNPEMTFTEVMRTVWADVETIGNGYLEITRDAQRQIDGFYHVPGTTVRVTGDRGGYVQIRGARRQWFRAFGSRGQGAEDASEILHFRKYTPESSYYGVPDIIAALPAIAGDKAAREYNLDFFEHNAVPRMAIIVEGGQLSEALLRQIQGFMESEVRGHGHKTLVLDVPGDGVKVRLEPLTVGMADDAAFLGYRKANRDEIMMVHRVPPSKVTVIENANLANSQDQDKTFREQVIRPEQRAIEYQMNRLIREALGIRTWEFRFREMDLGEEREHAEIARLYQEMGVWTPEEVRGHLGLKASA